MAGDGKTAPRFTFTGARLEPREVDVICLAAQGLDDAQIGERLHFSRGTVINVMHEVRSRLGFHTRTDVVRFAYDRELVEPHRDGARRVIGEGLNFVV